MNPIMPTAFHAMIATPHYLASMVGGRILQQGGNAFDAAVAVSAALAVVYPHMTGLGGDAFMLMYSAKEKRITGLNGTGRSGRRATPEFYLSQGLTSIPQRGVQSAVTVPGMVDAWWEVSAKYGRLPWDALLAPAAAYAEEGFPISRNLYYWMCRNEQLIRGQAGLARTYMRSGKLLLPGDRLVQPELAAAMRAVQEQGRDAFYKGKVMQAIVDAIRKDGGCLEEEDFASHRSDWVEPLSTAYRGHEIYQMPPNSQGFSALMMMNMLESLDLAAVPRESAQFYHLMTEVVKKAFRDRDRYLTDPDFADIPLDRLLSKEYARKLFQELPLHPPQGAPFLSRAIGQDTAYAAVVDDEGNAVSFIQSLYFDFGSGYVAGASGVLMQNRGSFFSLDADEANVLAPRKRCFHTLMPAMICRGGKPTLLFGTQGGEGQPQTQLSVMTGVLDYGCTIQEALALPRWVYGRTWGEDGDALRIENRGFEGIGAELQQWGHKVELMQPWDGMMGQAQGISIGPNGLLSGAADPRGDGIAFGW